MQFIIGNLRKLYVSVKTRPEIFLTALSVALIFAGWRFWDFHREVSLTYIKISMKSTVDGTSQLYYDTGYGLNEGESVRVSVTEDRNYRDYRFPLPGKIIYGLRFDPLMTDGSVGIRQVQWVDGLGAALQTIHLNQLEPLHQIESFDFRNQEIEIVINQKANDPQIGIRFDRPLAVGAVSLFRLHLDAILVILIECIVIFAAVASFLFCLIILRKNTKEILSNKKIPHAMLLAAVAVISMEVLQQTRLPATAHYHEVDELLYQLKVQKISADYMLLGDSVGRQLFKSTPDLQNENYAMLATNQAITMTGQYFIAKRYLERNRAPRAVVMLTQGYIHGNLDQNLSDNYIQRTFTDFTEIYEIFRLKRDPVFSAKMLAYRFLPSFKYRLTLQKDWTGFTNAESISGIAYDNRERSRAGYPLSSILTSYIEKKNIPLLHFESLLSLLGQHHIPLFLLTPAANENSADIRRTYMSLCEELFLKLQKTYPSFHFDKDLPLLRNAYFADGTHFNEAGLKIETWRLCEKMFVIQNFINDNNALGF